VVINSWPPGSDQCGQLLKKPGRLCQSADEIRCEDHVEGPQIRRQIRGIADFEVGTPSSKVGRDPRPRQLTDLPLHHHLKGKFASVFQLAGGLDERMREVYANHRRAKRAQFETRATNGASDIQRSGGSRHSSTIDEFMHASDRKIEGFAWSRTLFSESASSEP
jgi:hypothetical protein